LPKRFKMQPYRINQLIYTIVIFIDIVDNLDKVNLFDSGQK